MPLTGLWVPDIWSNIIWYFWEGVWDESNTWETAEGRFPSLISWRSEQDKKVDSPKKRECLISNVFKLGRHMFPAFRFQLKYQLSSWDFNSWSLLLHIRRGASDWHPCKNSSTTLAENIEETVLSFPCSELAEELLRFKSKLENRSW